MVWGSEFTAQGSGVRFQGLAPDSNDGPDVTPRPIVIQCARVSSKVEANKPVKRSDYGLGLSHFQ